MSGSTNMIMINAKNTVDLIEKCIAMKEDRLLRSGNYEPWGFVFLYGALGLLQAHLNLKAAADAKASAIDRLKSLQHRLHQVRPPPSPEELEMPMGAGSGSSLSGPILGPDYGPSDRQQSVLFQGTSMAGPRMVGTPSTVGTPGMMMHDFPNMQPFGNSFDFQPYPEQVLGDFFNFMPESWPFQ